jgi:DNA-binding FadR family transcriptional regulator
MIRQPTKKRRPATRTRPARATRRPAAGMFARLNREPAYRRVAVAIEDKILKRTLRPGDPLPTETVLAQQFGVNRSTVREALRRLESAGLVGRLNGSKRLLVTRPGPAETASRVSHALALDEVTFVELWEAMLAIAPRTAALAAQRSDAAGHARLDEVVSRVEMSRSADAAVAAVVGFFGAIAELSGNRVLVLSNQPLTRLLAPSLRRMIDRVPQARSRIVVAQRCIAGAIRAADAAEAESWMARHVQDFRRGYELAGLAPETKVVPAAGGS